ncbi:MULTISPECIES: homoserine kinase [Metallibacterium]|jgi:homoserine kinase|uniref:homoserine kinase n=1 Tax=Metallibacterium TaxID=1218803 RepID=UPI0026298658|nr:MULTISPECIES: homoserine kinase [Metallibacterium]MBW8076090.1 homoserine kinase [Metallibacterium scheffleri]
MNVRMQPEWALARAPASVGNVAAGFDLLGHTFTGPCDEVLARRSTRPGVRIAAITGSAVALPREATRNTAGVALLALLDALRPGFGIEIEIRKGIAFGAGLGGSAASSVAALVAANALLPEPLSREALYPHAISGEAASSGARHGDNVGPMLLGGLTLTTAERVLRVPVPPGLHCAVVHPHYVLETRRARAVLTAPYALHDVVRQNAHLAQLLAGCYRGDLELLREGLHDVLVEPRRAPLVPGFARVKQALLDAGALGGSLSGAGPSVFAWCRDVGNAQRAHEAMRAAFRAEGLDSEGWVAPVEGPAAEVVECGS